MIIDKLRQELKNNSDSHTRATDQNFFGETVKLYGVKTALVSMAAAVTLIVPARKGSFLKDVFESSDILMPDEDDLVRKGYGWLLKAASEAHQKEVFDYVMKNKKQMSRTALRYAIEKMPAEMKAEAMTKDPIHKNV